MIALLPVVLLAAPACPDSVLSAQDEQVRVNREQAQSRASAFSVAAATEFGVGYTWPTLHVPAYHFKGRVGFSVWSDSKRALLVFGDLGIDAAINVHSGLQQDYGYLIRVPIGISGELIWSKDVDRVARKFVNYHLGLGVGADPLLAAVCNGECSYVQPAAYPGVSARLGVSYSATDRSSVGLFVIPHLSFASDTQGGTALICTWSFALGWTLF